MSTGPSTAPYPTGWHNDPAAVQAVLSTMPRPFFQSSAPNLQGSGAGKTVLLYKAWKDALGHYVPYVAQTIGDCVSHGHGHGVDLIECVQIAIGKKAEAFHETSTEAIYGMARVDIGGGSLWADGAVGAWAAKAITTLGTVSRDVTGPYDGRKAKSWGSRGVPAEIKSKAVEHKVKTTSLVTTWAELEDALANGYPVTVCSNQGFAMTRNADGFCRASGHWGHCMLICGVRADKPGACIFQSWGANVPDGPLALDQPDNSFWAERSVVERMLAGDRDSWALSGFDGYPGQALPSHWSWEDLAA